MTFRPSIRLEFWKAPVWLWPVALSSALCLWSFELTGVPVPPWVGCLLCLAAFSSCWDVLLQGLLPFLLYHRPGRETLPVIAALTAFAASFALSAFALFNPLPDTLVDEHGRPLVFYHVASTILLLTLAARPWVSSSPLAREDDERVLPPLVAESWTLFGSHTILALAFAALVVWVYRGGTFEMAVSAGLAAMIAADPFFFIDLRAMLSVGLDRRLQTQGVRLESREVLRTLGTCDVVVLQKSEILTRGLPSVENITTLDPDCTETQVLRYAAAAQFGVRHPIRAAILNHPRVAGGTIPRVKGYELLSARGVRALLQGRDLLCGNLRLLEEEGIADATVADLRARFEPAYERGDSVLFVALDGVVLGAIELRDPLRHESWKAVRALRALGVQVKISSGEEPCAVRAESLDLAPADIWSGLSLEERSRRIRSHAEEGQRVAVVASSARHQALFEHANVALEWPSRHDSTDRPAALNPARVDVRLTTPHISAVCEVLRLSRRYVVRVRRGQIAVALYYLAWLPVVTGALQPVGGPAPSPTLAAFSFVLLRQLGVRLLRIGLR